MGGAVLRGPGLSGRACEQSGRCTAGGDLSLDDEGVAVRGLLVRHLVMPGGAAGTPDVMAFLAGLSPYTM
jgi:uncharacterized Fe-S radical SAM superfamily protein PflX